MLTGCVGTTSCCKILFRDHDSKFNTQHHGACAGRWTKSNTYEIDLYVCRTNLVFMAIIWKCYLISRSVFYIELKLCFLVSLQMDWKLGSLKHFKSTLKTSNVFTSFVNVGTKFLDLIRKHNKEVFYVSLHLGICESIFFLNSETIFILCNGIKLCTEIFFAPGNKKM